MTAKKHLSWMKRALCLVLAAVLSLQSGIAVNAEEEEEVLPRSKPGDICAYGAVNDYGSAFFVPTHVYQYGGEFFLADAYNNQVLCTRNVYDAPAGWSPVGMHLNRPHAIASDGVVYLVVDTDNNRIVTYIKTETGFMLVESIENVGIRPHYTVYDAATRQFYVWSSMTGTMYTYRRAKNSLTLTLTGAKQVKGMNGFYTRSFTMEGNNVYLPCVGLSTIYVANKRNMKIRAAYPVAAELGEMVQLLHIQNYYYLVTSADSTGEKTARIVRSKTLAGFGNGQYEDIREAFGEELNGVPYYITQGEDGHFYTPIIVGSCDAYICKFDIINDVITNVEHLKY